MHRTRRAPGRRTLASLAIGALLASAATTLVAAPALAAPVETTGGSLTWGIDAQYRSVFTTRSATAPATLSNDLAVFPHSAGEYDEETGVGSVSFSGGIRLGYIGGPPTNTGLPTGNFVALANPTIAIDGDSAVLSGTTSGSSHDLTAGLPTVGPATRSFADLDLGAVEPVVTESSITWTDVPATITTQGADVLAGFVSSTDAAGTRRAAGSSLDPVTITVDRTAEEEEAPSAPAVATTTSIAVAPAATVVRGQQTTITATVAATSGAAVPNGSVAFVATPASGSAIDLGTVALSNGVAAWSGTLPAGGHYLSASYTGASGTTASFAASSAQLAGTGQPGSPAGPINYSVVDTAQPAAYVVSSPTATATDVSARWNYSTYSYLVPNSPMSGWTKSATGDISVDGETFVLTGGDAEADAGGVVIDFTGSLRVSAYKSLVSFQPAGVWLELVDPSLAIAADGTGTWTAGVRSGQKTENDSAPVRVVVSTFRGAAVPNLVTAGSASIDFDYEGTTAAGTWSRNYDDAWANGFVAQVPTAIRAFYYATGASLDGTKPALPLSVQWPAGTVVEPEPTDAPKVSVAPNADLDPNIDNILTVKGTGFTGAGAASGAYVLFGAKSVWSGGRALPSAGWIAQAWVPAGSIVGGAFETTLSVPKGSIVPGTEYQVATSAAHRLSTSDRSLDTFTPVTVKDVVVKPVINLSIDTVLQGGQLTVTGAGLEAGKTAVVTVNSDPYELGRTTVGADGRFSVSGTLPATFATGSHTVTVSVDGVVLASAPLTVAATLLPAAVETPQAETCTARAVSGASITWNVRESFRSYIQGSVAKGSYSINWGAGNGAYNTEDDRGRVAYSGSASFTGHSGALDMTLSNPRIQVTSATSASLILDVRSAGYGDNAAVSANGVVFATLRLPSATETADRISWSGASATLTAAGAEAFSGFYSAGESLDPVSFSFPLGAEVDCDSTTSTTLARTGSEQGAETLWIGLGLLLLGAGVFALRRRTARV